MQKGIKITTWNYCGLQNAVPYLNHLIDKGSDIIAVSEHWFWPCQVPILNDVHRDFEGYGVAGERLNEHSAVTLGCGGVGMIWNKNLQVSPTTNMTEYVQSELS